MVDGQFTGYAIEKEDRESLKRTATTAEVLILGELPVRVDPRKSPLAEKSWLKVENQGQIGSCAGNALTECMEYCYPIATGGNVVQLSRMYAYILSQKKSNIRGDSGSTLDGNTKAAADGICTESVGPYPRSYPGWGYITAEMVADAEKYKMRTHIEISSANHLKQYIGSGIGIPQIGIAWGGGTTPNSKGCITGFSGGGGGHSVVFAGYVPDDDIGVKSTAGWWGLLKNSWGSNWGIGGYAYVDPKAINQMIRHSWSTFYGRSDMETPSPRPLPVDWTKESVFG